MKFTVLGFDCSSGSYKMSAFTAVSARLLLTLPFPYLSFLSVTSAYSLLNLECVLG